MKIKKVHVERVVIKDNINEYDNLWKYFNNNFSDYRVTRSGPMLEVGSHELTDMYAIVAEKVVEENENEHA